MALLLLLPLALEALDRMLCVLECGSCLGWVLAFRKVKATLMPFHKLCCRCRPTGCLPINRLLQRRLDRPIL
jgi:hypothetical protein